METSDTENVSVFADCNIMDTVDEIDIMSQVLIMINYEKKQIQQDGERFSYTLGIQQLFRRSRRYK